MSISTPVMKHVLLVDDDPILLAVLESFFLDGRAEKVFTATNGIEAVEVAKRLAGDLNFILCDLNMPGMDGVQFLRNISECQYSGNIAILSGEDRSILSLAARMASSHNLNLVGALSKPVNYDELDRVIIESFKDPNPEIANNVAKITEGQLRDAIAKNQITSFYQPKIEVATGKLVGVEALARWICPERGLIGPDQFIPLAEESGQIYDLTSCIIDATCSNADTWRKIDPNFKIAINLSVAVLNNLLLPDEIAVNISTHGLVRSNFTFEITESQLLEQKADPMEVLARLRMMGFELSIDDFGTGYSNLEVLREFPFSELKIDRSFITNAMIDNSAKAGAEACIDLGKKLGMRLVAEGIEKMEDWEFVAHRDVDHLQGFLIAKPMPMDKLKKWISAYQTQSVNMSRALKFG